MIFKLVSGEGRLWLTADTANHFVASLQRPDWEVRFDMDKAAAIATRKRVFGDIAKARAPFSAITCRSRHRLRRGVRRGLPLRAGELPVRRLTPGSGRG